MLDQDTCKMIYQTEWETVQRRIHHYFAHREPLERVQRYVEGLMSDIRRRNSWQLNESPNSPDPRSDDQNPDLRAGAEPA